MKQKNKLEVFTYGKFDFELLSEDEINIICSSLLSSILEIHKDKQRKRRKQNENSSNLCKIFK